MKPGEKFSSINEIRIDRHGIFVLENTGLSGMITGDPDETEWMLLSNGKSVKFRNPVHRLRSHIKALKRIMPEKYRNYVYGAVTFRTGSILNISGAFHDGEFIITDAETDRLVESFDSVNDINENQARDLGSMIRSFLDVTLCVYTRSGTDVSRVEQPVNTSG